MSLVPFLEPKTYGILVYSLKKIAGSYNFH